MAPINPNNDNNENNNDNSMIEDMAKRVKDSTKKSAGKAVKIGALKFTAFLSPFLITVIILILTFFIGSSIISNVAELFEAKNTPEKIYDMLEIAADEDLSKLVEVKDDGKTILKAAETFILIISDLI